MRKYFCEDILSKSDQPAGHVQNPTRIQIWRNKGGEALRFLANSARPLVCESPLKTHLAYFLQSSISPRKSTLISLLNKPCWTQQQ
jgi:hypothetical protein